MNEENTKLKLITPAIINAGWNIKTQVDCEHYFTDGEIIVRGKFVARGKQKFVDYLLSIKNNLPIAIVEAKSSDKTLGHGMQQGLEYAAALDIPYVYSSNGSGFLEHDRITGAERSLTLEEFPSPEELWSRYCSQKGFDIEDQNILTTPYHYEIGGFNPRYYQRVAVNRVVEAVAKGRNRLLLVMATGERVIIVTGCINVLVSRVSGTLTKYNSCIA